MPDEIARILGNYDAFPAAFSGEDERSFLGFLDEDVEWVPIMAALEGRSYHGHDGLRQWFADLRRDWEAFEPHAEEIHELGDGHYLVLGRWLARGKESGVELAQAAAWLSHWRDGFLTRLQTFTTQEEGLRAADEVRRR